jgi:hypothetical protein
MILFWLPKSIKYEVGVNEEPPKRSEELDEVKINEGIKSRRPFG